MDRKRGRSNKNKMTTMMNRQMLINNKRIAKERDYEIGLILSIHHVEGIDNLSNYPSITNRIYRVVFWVYPDCQFATEIMLRSPDPAWNQKVGIELDKSQDCRFLYVEVFRYGSPSESNPGTFNGLSLIGIARINLPKLSSKKGGRYGLVRLKENGYKAEGHIILSMELVKVDN